MQSFTDDPMAVNTSEMTARAAGERNKPRPSATCAITLKTMAGLFTSYFGVMIVAFATLPCLEYFGFNRFTLVDG
jgi:hypothetical protein